jgi:hypothetical protein
MMAILTRRCRWTGQVFDLPALSHEHRNQTCLPSCAGKAWSGFDEVLGSWVAKPSKCRRAQPHGSAELWYATLVRCDRTDAPGH